jgi:predicted outer membrane lipoprotein
MSYLASPSALGFLIKSPFRILVALALEVKAKEKRKLRAKIEKIVFLSIVAY